MSRELTGSHQGVIGKKNEVLVCILRHIHSYHADRPAAYLICNHWLSYRQKEGPDIRIIFMGSVPAGAGNGGKAVCNSG